MRLLLAEDDPQLGDGLAVGLRQAGHAVDWVRDGREADTALKSGDYALLVLDLGLPRLDGMQVLAQLRARRQPLPVLVLTARDGEHDKIAGLDGGADDYLVKPVGIGELSARIRALTRRAGEGAAMPETELRHGELRVLPATREVFRGPLPVTLSALEFSLLEALLQHRGRVMTRAQLEAAIYGWNDTPDSNALEFHIHHLRRKLGSELIQTLRGVGYMIPQLPVVTP
ncbi:MAG: response regulator transcription factor [Rhodocyclaceae bacterium]|nr:response regulator transcription factor [Rhodocyclaceae bacterium]